MKQYVVVIVGGGIHGAGVLQAAAAHSALLIERRALASGTSSRSSKLIHGGLRYLESGQFSLVRVSLRERAIMLKIASDLVELKSLFIPVYRDTRRRQWQLKLGRWLYPLPEEEEYLLDVVRHYFAAFRHSMREHITQRFAGLRVLPAATQAVFGRSRETIFSADRAPKPRVLGIYGGKLTGWRATPLTCWSASALPYRRARGEPRQTN